MCVCVCVHVFGNYDYNSSNLQSFLESAGLQWEAEEEKKTI